MRRLYLHVYLTVLLSLLLFGFLASLAWWLSPSEQDSNRLFEGVATTLGDLLPAADSPAGALQASLNRLAERLGTDLTVRGTDGSLLAAAGDPLPAPPPHRERSGWMPSRGAGPTAAFLLPDGRWLIARSPHRRRSHLALLGLLAVAIAVGAYPVVRRLTRRLERLQARVDRLGSGDLAARVGVEGSDEVASLARSFNRAADRIERLVRAQRSVLASASHELRSPLARLRVAIELLAGDERPELRARIEKDIAELDELIGELLLASRLEAIEELDSREEVDLLALVAEEAAHIAAEVSGEPVRIQGDPRLLRRLVRNLMENARRYAEGSTVEAVVSPLEGGGACLTVADRGPGVAEEDRERIFEPFYRPRHLRSQADGGVGLGLALVRQIAERHGGETRCLPREGGGTQLEVTLRPD